MGKKKKRKHQDQPELPVVATEAEVGNERPVRIIGTQQQLEALAPLAMGLDADNPPEIRWQVIGIKEELLPHVAGCPTEVAMQMPMIGAFVIWHELQDNAGYVMEVDDFSLGRKVYVRFGRERHVDGGFLKVFVEDAKGTHKVYEGYRRDALDMNSKRNGQLRP